MLCDGMEDAAALSSNHGDPGSGLSPALARKQRRAARDTSLSTRLAGELLKGLVFRRMHGLFHLSATRSLSKRLRFSTISTAGGTSRN
jgi:hypothetical protein